MSKQMIVRIDPGVKARVDSLAKSEGRTTSEVVRELLADYVRTHDRAGYIDDLWRRVGDKLAARGLRAADVPRIVRQVRRKS